MADVFGVHVEDLEPGAMPIEVVVLVKALDAQGGDTVYTRTSAGLSDFEKLGLLSVESRRISDFIAGCFIDENEAPDE